MAKIQWKKFKSEYTAEFDGGWIDIKRQQFQYQTYWVLSSYAGESGNLLHVVDKSLAVLKARAQAEADKL